MIDSATARSNALSLFEAINAKDLTAVLDHYAEDGKVTHPFGEFEGKAALEEFYGGLVLQADTHLSFGRVAAEGNCCAVELIAVSPQAPDTPQYALDMVEFNDAGKIQHLSVYYLNFNVGQG